MSLLQRITRALMAPVSAGRVLGRAVGAGSGDPIEMDADAVDAIMATLADPVAHLSDLHDEQTRTAIHEVDVVTTDADKIGIHIPWTSLPGMWLLCAWGQYSDGGTPATELMRSGIMVVIDGDVWEVSGIIDEYDGGALVGRTFIGKPDWPRHVADTTVTTDGPLFLVAPDASSGTQSGRILGFRID